MEALRAPLRAHSGDFHLSVDLPSGPQHYALTATRIALPTVTGTAHRYSRQRLVAGVVLASGRWRELVLRNSSGGELRVPLDRPAQPKWVAAVVSAAERHITGAPSLNEHLNRLLDTTAAQLRPAEDLCDRLGRSDRPGDALVHAEALWLLARLLLIVGDTAEAVARSDEGSRRLLAAGLLPGPRVRETGEALAEALRLHAWPVAAERIAAALRGDTH
ncbi:hypothetical protein [Kitasatospora sp. MBT63]|uniref:hypothetical protein n=1 Tax=Kitasatospora sp. MBT63 TaxID=1444768 RepID=UPI000539D0AB|nr:hypothetical protein [Kitasatospora sp. MBT63]